MKRVLINSNEPGRVLEVANPGEEFEVHPDFVWVDCDHDDVSQDWTYEVDENDTMQWREINIALDTDFATEGYKFARMIAYKDIGEQLDMIYKELMANGTLSADGPWASHITAVKNEVPKDDPEAVIAWYDQTAPSED